MDQSLSQGILEAPRQPTRLLVARNWKGQPIQLHKEKEKERTVLMSKIIISETATSTWNYHLRELGEDGPKYGGGVDLISVCGIKLGWDTEISLSQFDPEFKAERICDGHFCGKCFDVAKKKGWL